MKVITSHRMKYHLGLMVLGLCASMTVAQTLPPDALPLPAVSVPVLPPASPTAAPSPTPPLPLAPAIASTPVAPPVPPPANALPVVPATTAATPAAAPITAQPDQAASLPPPPKRYSYGNATNSILFLPADIERMKQAIRIFEDTGKTAVAATPVETVAPPTVVDRKEYPVFYLASIAYDAPGDWSLWVSGYKITSRVNPTDLTVVNVTRDSATFLWQPSYGEAIKRRVELNAFAPTAAVKHKLSQSQSIRFDEEREAMTFTLKPNQSFAVGYFKLFEGFVDSPALEALPAPVPAAQAGTNPLDPATNPPIDPGQQALPVPPPPDPVPLSVANP